MPVVIFARQLKNAATSLSVIHAERSDPSVMPDPRAELATDLGLAVDGRELVTDWAAGGRDRWLQQELSDDTEMRSLLRFSVLSVYW
mmetsp:Transcript_34459/g.53801  ORF Transcript_34459/g.53801 Transcript_34459/m.53801 type:complete len:87 (+) Transcript_34459:849-1109(+)